MLLERSRGQITDSLTLQTSCCSEVPSERALLSRSMCSDCPCVSWSCLPEKSACHPVRKTGKDSWSLNPLLLQIPAAFSTLVWLPVLLLLDGSCLGMLF